MQTAPKNTRLYSRVTRDNMKALQRDDEIIPEPWSQWTIDHLEWLTTPRPEGDGYTLIEDYQPEPDE